MIIVILFLKSWISWKSQAYVFQFSYQQQSQLISKLMNAYLDVPYHFLLGKNSANIIQNIIDETKKFANGVLITLLTTVSNLIVVDLVDDFALLDEYRCSSRYGRDCTTVCFSYLNDFRTGLIYWGRESSQANEAIIRTVNHGLGSIKETKILGCKTYFEDHIAIHATDMHSPGGVLCF